MFSDRDGFGETGPSGRLSGAFLHYVPESRLSALFFWLGVGDSCRQASARVRSEFRNTLF